MTVSIQNAALVALLRSGERPWSEYAELVEARGGATGLLEEEGGVNPSQPRLFGAESQDVPSLLDSATADIARWEAQGMHLTTVLDPGYPSNLRDVHGRPPLLFVSGRLEPRDARSVAIVGARTASRSAARQAKSIATDLAANGFTVVSGLATGIDTAAHTATLATGGRTIAVVGTGLRRCYPPENVALQRKIAAEGAVVSQFWPEAPPTRRSFPMRNAVLSGMTVATVVVEASHTGGTRIQTGLALAQGRPVFLWEPVLKLAWAREYAAMPGARVVGSASEVMAALEHLPRDEMVAA